MTPPLNLFPGPTKTRILATLAEAAPEVVYAEDLCLRALGSTETRARNTMKVLVSQMRPKLQAFGFDILGRKALKCNAYRLVNTLLEGDE